MWIKKDFRYMLTAAIALATVVVLTQDGAAITVDAVTRTQNGSVSDTANMLSPQAEDRLNEMIDAFEAKTGGEIAVVTVNDTRPSQSPNVFAMDLLNQWRVGKPDQGNGVLLLISKDDQRAAIKAGKGLSRKINQVRSQRILRQYVTPYFQRQQFDAGTLLGIEAIITAVEGGRWNDLRPPIVPSNRVVNGLQDPRQQGKWVLDKADLINDATESQLNQQINQLEEDTGAEIVIVTVPEARPSASPKDLAQALFEQWLVGKAGMPYGYLWVISKHDRQLEVIGSPRHGMPFLKPLKQTSINPDLAYLVNRQDLSIRDTRLTSRIGPHTASEAIQADGEWGTATQTSQGPKDGGPLSNMVIVILLWVGGFYGAVYLCQWLIYWMKGLFGVQNRQKPSLWALIFSGSGGSSSSTNSFER